MSNPNKPRNEIEGQSGMNEWLKENAAESEFDDRTKGDYPGIDDRTLADIATSPDVGPRLSEAAEAELKRRGLEVANNSEAAAEAEPDDSKETRIAELEEEFAGDAGDLKEKSNNKFTFIRDKHGNICDKYGNIFGKVRVVEKDKVKQDKIGDEIRASETGDEAADTEVSNSEKNKTIFEDTLNSINTCNNPDTLDDWKVKIEKGYARLSDDARERAAGDYQQVIDAINKRISLLDDAEYRHWQEGQMEEYNELSNSDKAHFLAKVKHNFDLADERFGVQLKEAEDALESEYKKSQEKLMTPDEFFAELEARRDAYFAKLDKEIDLLKISYENHLKQMYADFVKNYSRSTDGEGESDVVFEDDGSSDHDTSSDNHDNETNNVSDGVILSSGHDAVGKDEGETVSPFIETDFDVSSEKGDDSATDNGSDGFEDVDSNSLSKKFEDALSGDSSMMAQGTQDRAFEILDDFFKANDSVEDTVQPLSNGKTEATSEKYPDSCEYAKNIKFKDGDDLESYLYEIKRLYIDRGEDAKISNRAYSILQTRFDEFKNRNSSGVGFMSQEEFEATPEGLRLLFNNGSGFSYGSSIRRFDRSDLEGKTFTDTSKALGDVLRSCGRGTEYSKYESMLKKKYNELGLDENGLFSEERAKEKFSIGKIGKLIGRRFFGRRGEE